MKCNCLSEKQIKPEPVYSGRPAGLLHGLRWWNYTGLVFWSVICLNGLMAPVALAERQVINLKTDWRFARGNPPGAAAVNFDDAHWQSVSVPHDWAISGPFDPGNDGNSGKLPWQGEGWYRRRFTLDAQDTYKRMYVAFDGAMAQPAVYVNGKLAGRWDYGYNSFWLDVTELAVAGENVLAVYLDTRRHGSRWYPGAGLYRKVQLILCDPVHVDLWGACITTPQVSEEKAQVKLTVSLHNYNQKAQAVAVETTLLTPAGRKAAVVENTIQVPAGQPCSLEQAFVIEKPQRWDLATPALYKAVTVLRYNGKIADVQETSFGVRTFAFTATDGFYLNERRVPVKGVNLHHDQGPLGARFYPRAMERQLEIMKEMGCNAIRTSHNVPAPELLDLCDRMGFIVLNEAFDKWDSTADWHGEEPLAAFMERQIGNFVRRDRNHPSVVLWSVGNEMVDIELNQDGQAREKLKLVVDLFRKYDATRPVTLACHIPQSLDFKLYELYDVQSWNYGRKYALAHQADPNRAVLCSESASALSTRGHYELPLPANKTDYSASLQVSSYDHHAAAWADVPDEEFAGLQQFGYACGEFVWTGFDYLGEPAPYNTGLIKTGLIKGNEQCARSSYFGIVDLCGLPKDRYYLYRSYWAPQKTTVHILPHWNWEGREGQPVPVYVYTNGDAAELFLNGRSLGRRAKLKDMQNYENLARNKPVRCSSMESARGNYSVLANDGDPATRWCAADETAPQWLLVDLGEVKPLGTCLIHFEHELSSYTFQVEVSSDGVNWQCVAEKTGFEGSGKMAGYNLNMSGQMVRIAFTGLNGAWASICELELYAETLPLDVKDRYRLRWLEVAYEPGELKAVAYQNDQFIGQAIRQTAGAPAALRLTPDRAVISASGDDLSYVTVEMADARGVLCPKADQLVHFTVEGPAEIIAVDNGNPQSLEPFVADYRKLFYGKAMVILRSVNGHSGKARLTAVAEGVAAASVVIECK